MVESELQTPADDVRTYPKYPCTCQAPSCVELPNGTDEYCGSHQAELLLENLKHFGWSPISVDNAPNPCPSHGEVLKLFPPGGSNNSARSITECNDVAYHAAESGSSEGSVEPKESYEVQLSKCVPNYSSPFSPEGGGDEAERLIKTWCRTLSWIAHQVCTILRVPPNTLLAGDTSNYEDSLDLLRVFHYYTTTKPGELGSSPHTDWGSLTIVWQDDVGGLQTYCRVCRKWVDVEAPSSSPSSLSSSSEDEHLIEGKCKGRRWKCIVHIGDMASLVLDLDNEDDSVVRDSPSKMSETNPTTMCWPSPKHRVVSSATRERTSLVYFGYPPANRSLQNIKDALRDWQPSMRGHRLPLSDYYLLRDQSTTSSGGGRNDKNSLPQSEVTSPSATPPEKLAYGSIRGKNIREVISWKWSQVQRE